MADPKLVTILTAKDLTGPAFRAAGGHARKYGKVMTASVIAATVAATAALAAFIKSLNESSAYGDAMADMVKVTDQSFESIKASIETIAPALGSSTELVKGYYQTISAGITDPTKALEFLTTASQFAKSAHIEQAAAVEALAKIMNGYQGDIESAADAADLLFSIEAKGIVKVGELIPIIGSLATQSKNMGVETTEMAGALAHLTKVSGSASEAGTKYQAVLTALMKGNEHLKEAYKEIGVESGRALIQQEGYVGALQKLKEYADSSGKELGDLFTRVEAISGANILASNSLNDLSDIIKDVEEDSGGLARAFEAQQETYTAITDTIKNQLINALAELGSTVMPDVIKSLNEFSKWWTDNQETIIAAVSAIFKAITFMATYAAKMISAFIPAATKSMEELNQAAIDQTNRLIEVNKKLLERDLLEGNTEGVKARERAIAHLTETLQKLHGTYDDGSGVVSGYIEAADELLDSMQDMSKVGAEWEGINNDIGVSVKKLGDKVKTLGDNADKTRLKILKFEKVTSRAFDIANAIDMQNRMAEAIEDTYDDYGKATDALYDYAEAVGRSVEEERELLRISGTFFEGMKLGWREILEAQIQWGREGERIVLEFYRMTSYTLGESLFAAVTGEWDEMRDVWKQLLDDMLRMLTNIVARMIMEWAALKIAGVFGFSVGGGGIPIGSIISGAGGSGGLFGPATSGGSSIPWGTSVGPAASAAYVGYSGYTAAELAAIQGSSWGGAGAMPAGGSSSSSGAGMGAGIGPGIAIAVAAIIAQGIYGMMKEGPEAHPINIYDEERKNWAVESAEYKQLTEMIRGEAGFQGDTTFESMQRLSAAGWEAGTDHNKAWDRLMSNLGQVSEFDNPENNEVMIDIVTNLVDNAGLDLEEKFEALGIVGEHGGWESEVTIAMIAEMVDSGIPWSQISSQLESYGVVDEEVFKDIVGHYTNAGMSLEDLQYMLQEAGVPEELLRTINATVDEVVANASSFNNFRMEADADSFNNFRMRLDDYDIPKPSAPGRQHGGVVLAGTPYIVGEAGPEMFVPNSSGYVHPNKQPQGNQQSKDIVINLTVPIDGLGETLQQTIVIAANDQIHEYSERVSIGMEPTRRL